MAIRIKPSFLAVALALALTSTAPARAAAPEAAGAGTAEALFTSGKEAMARGDFAAACARFSESLKLDPAIGTQLNLAACEERSGKLVSALERFEAARRDLGNDDFRVTFTTERIRSLSQRVARLTVRAPATPEAGLRVLRDGAEVAPAAWNVPALVDPGLHTIIAERPGGHVSKREITLGEGEQKVVDVPSDANTPAPPEAGGGAGPSPFAYVAGGIGLAGLVTGTVTGLVAMSAATDYRAHCENGECDLEGMSAARTGRTMSVVSPIAFAVGAAGTALGVVLFFTTRDTKRSATRIVPSATPWGGGVFVSRTF